MTGAVVGTVQGQRRSAATTALHGCSWSRLRAPQPLRLRACAMRDLSACCTAAEKHHGNFVVEQKRARAVRRDYEWQVEPAVFLCFFAQASYTGMCLKRTKPSEVNEPQELNRPPFHAILAASGRK